MTRFVGLDVSQKITAICVVNDTGRRLWRGQCPTSVACSRHSVPGAMRGMPFDRKAEALILHHSVVTLIVRPMLVAWRQVREEIAVFDKAIRVLVRPNSACRLLGAY